MSSKLLARNKLLRRIEAIKSEVESSEDSKKKRIDKAKQELEWIGNVNEDLDNILWYVEEFRLKLKSILIFLIIIAVLLIPIVIISFQLLLWYENLRY